jgi:hypothetical protein
MKVHARAERLTREFERHLTNRSKGASCVKTSEEGHVTFTQETLKRLFAISSVHEDVVVTRLAPLEIPVEAPSQKRAFVDCNW